MTHSDSDSPERNCKTMKNFEDRIAEVEEAFELQWRENRCPNIDTYLGYVEKGERERLLEKLVAIDIEQRIKGGESVSQNAYRKYGSDIPNFAREILEGSESQKTPHGKFERKSIGRYRLLQKIGEGGMGTVYMADQVEPIRRRIAVKLIRVKNNDDTNKIMARFEAERQALAMMNHENICQILDAGADDGVPYFVMELVKGIPITEYCDKMKLSIRDRLDLFLKVCLAVQHAHQKGIIHRDLKPSNILVAPHDGKPVPKVIDFGLAKTLDAENRLTDRTMFTDFGMVLGTARYMSPEQAELNQLDVDTRSDIYSLGVILYELLTGSIPRNELDMGRELTLDVLQKIQQSEPLRPSLRLSTKMTADATVPSNRNVSNSSKLQQLIRGELDWIVMKALERDRYRRYETVNAFHKDIKRYLDGEPVLAGPPSKIYQLKKFVHKYWRSISAASAALVASVTLVVFAIYWIQNENFNMIQLDQARDRAARVDFQSAKEFWNGDQIKKYQETLARVPPGNRHIEWYVLKNLNRGIAVHGHAISTLSMALSPDGSTLATGGNDQQIVVWDVESKSIKYKIKSPHGVSSVYALAFHPSKKLLVSGGLDKFIRFWDSETGDPSVEYSPVECRARVYSLDISNDGKKVAACGGSDINDRKKNDQFISVWDLDDSSHRTQLDGHQRRVTQVKFNAEASKLLSCSCDLNVRLWDLANGKTSGKWRVSSLAWDCEFINGEKDILVGTEDNFVYLLNAEESGKTNWRRKGHRKGEPVFCLAVSHDGNQFATGAFDGTVKLWDKQGDVIETMIWHEGNVCDLTFTADDSQLISVGLDGRTRFREINQGLESMVFDGHQESVNAIDFSPDSKLLISGSGFDERKQQPYNKRGPDDNSVRVWDLSDGKCLETHQLEIGPITDVQFDPRSNDGDRFIAGGARGKIKLIDRSTGLVVWEKVAHEEGVNSLEFDSGGNRLATVGKDGSMRVWNSTNGDLIFQYQADPDEDVLSVDWSDDNQWIAIGTRSGLVVLIDVDKQEKIWAEDGGRKNHKVNVVKISPDKQVVYVGQPEIHALDSNTGETLASFANHYFETYSMDLHTQGRSVRLLTGSHNGSWKLWDTENMDELLSFVPFSKRIWNHVFDVKFSPDGQKIAIANSDSRIQIWDCSHK